LIFTKEILIFWATRFLSLVDRNRESRRGQEGRCGLTIKEGCHR